MNFCCSGIDEFIIEKGIRGCIFRKDIFNDVNGVFKFRIVEKCIKYNISDV